MRSDRFAALSDMERVDFLKDLMSKKMIELKIFERIIFSLQEVAWQVESSALHIARHIQVVADNLSQCRFTQFG